MSSYIIPLLSQEASLARAGGKGKNLAELARAGFEVPHGFIITTDAYRLFAESNRLQPRILALADTISLDDLAHPTYPAALESTSAEIGSLFMVATMPSALATEITSAYSAMLLGLSEAGLHGSSSNSPTGTPLPVPLPVAVRSSATAEDLPGLAFAGQQDTYLNIVGERALLDAVKRCWASLWTARAMAYRARAGS